MQTEDFLALVLPAEGFRCIAIPTKKGGFQHIFCETNTLAAARAARLDADGRNVYFAVASFKSKESRKADNALALKSFIADVDCGEGKPYATKQDGAKAVLAFCKTVGLPRPYIIKSGRGLHCYWPLDVALDVATWRSTATLLKYVMIHADLKADPSRTSDAASVLRPVGTHHRKAAPLPVQLAVPGSITSHDNFLTALNSYAAAHEVELPLQRQASDGLNSDLSAGRDFGPANAQHIADQCAVMGYIRDTRGNCDQPTWYAGLGVIAFCENGNKLAHAWSEGHPDYDPAETETKLAQVSKFKPTTCGKLSSAQPQLCQACPHFNKINSPIALGYNAPQTVQIETEKGPVPVTLPKGYRVNDRGGLDIYTDKAAEDAKHDPWTPFCDTVFWPTARIKGEDGYQMELEMIVRGTETRRFTIPTSLIGRGGSELSATLAAKELVARSRMDHIVQAYLRNWMDYQREQADEVRSLDHFGWHDKSFLVGDTLYTCDGPKQVILTGNAERRQHALREAGDYEVWKETIDRLYNHANLQPLQYLVLIGFAAPLFAMLQEFGGVTVFAYSQQPGVGKTTAECAALSAWGRHDAMRMANTKATTNALWATVGTYHSIPVVYDEMTTLDDGKQIADMVFSISDGTPKIRCDATGLLRENNSNWRTIVSASGNNLLSEKLAIYRANAEAEICRIFEYNIPKLAAHEAPVSVQEATALAPRLLQNHGHAGREFINYVVTNYDEVRKLLQSTRSKINNYLKIQQSERYWSGLQASVFTALQICQRLDILQFDTRALLLFVKETTEKNRTYRDQLVSQPNDQFGKLLTDIWSNVLVTLGEGDLRTNAEAQVLQHPAKGQSLSGRAILPAAQNERAVLYLNANTIKDWCFKNGVTAKEIFDLGVSEGWISPNIERVNLGKGTYQYASVSSQVRAWQIDSQKLQGRIGNSPLAQKLQVVSNGNSKTNSGAGDQ